MKYLFLCGLLLCMHAPAQQTSLPAGTHDPDEPNPPSTRLSSARPSSIAPALAAAEDKIAARDYDAARPTLLSYLEQYPADARARFDLGYVEDSTGQQDAAERDYAKAIAADPKQFESHAALGLLYAQTNRADKALPMLETASQLEPASHDPAAKAQVWRSLAQLQLSHDPAAAKESLLKALQLVPGQDTPADLVLTGQIAEANSDPEDAATAYKRALAQDPASAAATSGLAHLLLKEQKPEEAEPLLRTAIAKHPEDAGLPAQRRSGQGGSAACGGGAGLANERRPAHQLRSEPDLHQAICRRHSHFGARRRRRPE
jgi:tetratricopeptide (TPR) repeat protein